MINHNAIAAILPQPLSSSIGTPGGFFITCRCCQIYSPSLASLCVAPNVDDILNFDLHIGTYYFSLVVSFEVKVTKYIKRTVTLQFTAGNMHNQFKITRAPPGALYARLNLLDKCFAVTQGINV